MSEYQTILKVLSLLDQAQKECNSGHKDGSVRAKLLVHRAYLEEDIKKDRFHTGKHYNSVREITAKLELSLSEQETWDDINNGTMRKDHLTETEKQIISNISDDDLLAEMKDDAEGDIYADVRDVFWLISLKIQ